MILTPHHAGYATLSGPNGTVEFTTYTCGHCGNVKAMGGNSLNPVFQPDLGGHCRVCDHQVCTICCDRIGIDGCIPFQKKIEEYERKVRFHQEVEALT